MEHWFLNAEMRKSGLSITDFWKSVSLLFHFLSEKILKKVAIIIIAYSHMI